MRWPMPFTMRTNKLRNRKTPSGWMGLFFCNVTLNPMEIGMNEYD